MDAWSIEQFSAKLTPRFRCHPWLAYRSRYRPRNVVEQQVYQGFMTCYMQILERVISKKPTVSQNSKYRGRRSRANINRDKCIHKTPLYAAL